MGLSSSKQKTTTNVSENHSDQTVGTQVPLTPDWLEEAAREYVGRVGEFSELDPTGHVAGPAPLQEQAWSDVLQLGGWQQPLGQAVTMASAQGNQAANLAAPSSGAWDPAEVSFHGYDAASIPAAEGYDPVQLGAIAQSQPSSLLENLDAYRSPYIEQVVKLSLAAQREASDREGARLKADGARAGAFGGSRFALAEGQFAADAAQDQAMLAAQLQDQAFRNAADLSKTDAAARQRASEFNAGEANRGVIAQAGLDSQAARDGLVERTERDLRRAELETEAERHSADADNAMETVNAAAQNDAARAGFDADRVLSMFNAGQADRAGERGIAVAQLLASLGLGQAGAARDDLRLMGDLGGQQRGVTQSQLLAPFAHLQAIGQLSGMTPYDILVGTQSAMDRIGESSSSGTSVTRQNPGLLNNLLAVARTAAPFF